MNRIQERSHPAFRTLPEIRTACGPFQPEEIRQLGFTVDIRTLGASEEFFQRALEARAEDARREGRSFRKPANTEAEIRARAAELGREIAASNAELEEHERRVAEAIPPVQVDYVRIWEAT